MNIKRRNLMSSAIAAGLAMPVAALSRNGHDHDSLEGPLSSATVSFGAWPAGSDTPLDRFDTPTAPEAPNVHQLFPSNVTIERGGSVNFIVAGFHVIAVYGPGTQPTDINTADTIQLPDGPPDLPPIINDARNRLYRGLNPLQGPQDRVEVVQFQRAGTFLVICAVLPHFQDEMWGFVRVLGT